MRQVGFGLGYCVRTLCQHDGGADRKRCQDQRQRGDATGRRLRLSGRTPGTLAEQQAPQLLLRQDRRTEFSQHLHSCSLARLHRAAQVAAPLGRRFRARPVDSAKKIKKK